MTLILKKLLLKSIKDKIASKLLLSIRHKINNNLEFDQDVDKYGIQLALCKHFALYNIYPIQSAYCTRGAGWWDEVYIPEDLYLAYRDAYIAIQLRDS